ncbi:hypothetical protein ZOSMA_12G00660 [Zostera marina]|uniref:Uncharacterized protein n=1 Tax=Zostera marina TaxID=29655 RepID=A0A0K9PZD6_ZOSMR|nr:hypothetical protein ZOSMA_12G00660 [Zostera marina]
MIDFIYGSIFICNDRSCNVYIWVAVIDRVAPAESSSPPPVFVVVSSRRSRLRRRSPLPHTSVLKNQESKNSD